MARTQSRDSSASASIQRPQESTGTGSMAKGVLVAFGIMLAAIPIPLAHWVLVPVSPFIAGFIGGGVAKADEARIMVFGLLVAGLMAIPAAAILLARYAFGVEEMLGVSSTLLVVFAFAIVPYAWFGVTVGALISYATRASQRKATQD